MTSDSLPTARLSGLSIPIGDKLLLAEAGDAMSKEMDVLLYMFYFRET